MNVTNGRCGSVAGAQQLIFIYRDVADRRHVRFVTKKCRTCFRESYVTVHSVHSNALRDAQKSCIRMISRRNSRVFCELCSQKTPRGTLPVNSNVKVSLFDNTWYYIFEDKKKRGRSTSIIHSIINIQCNHRYDLFNRRLFSVRCNCFPKSHRFRFSTFHCFPNSKLHFRS